MVMLNTHYARIKRAALRSFGPNHKIGIFGTVYADNRAWVYDLDTGRFYTKTSEDMMVDLEFMLDGLVVLLVVFITLLVICHKQL